MAGGLWNEFKVENNCSVFLHGLQVLEKKLSHKGLKQFKKALLYKPYSSAVETLDAECYNHWKFTNIKKTNQPTKNTKKQTKFLEKSTQDSGNLCFNNDNTSASEVS